MTTTERPTTQESTKIGQEPPMPVFKTTDEIEKHFEQVPSPIDPMPIIVPGSAALEKAQAGNRDRFSALRGVLKGTRTTQQWMRETRGD
uniref:Uncharacterized protein n=1 Tax=Candidatus Kentrum sp. FM TaxID=2126340 RepID=A0A450TD88_9GAMM|nr:MAG: hypothetical protein BECKFM1743C_GA0114222_103673 [Candidatus Kentron sp. FM]VFJ64841.1 MAG: hypothetical protein BECKFM1743A_GA0114220_103653 [Candidatus Kentron sp. FM]VFK15328.1 MAG: hypothetical protein BECKFM1743B_GA0114221_103663 [Candidatus Kentron sp. FM]